MKHNKTTDFKQKDLEHREVHEGGYSSTSDRGCLPILNLARNIYFFRFYLCFLITCSYVYI
ncbi:unnamed protein product [Brassica oleracea var. botrytis]|uniref:(rape) hypothetical protein n=1 Tax=Brassica napus TaxID=3708 RepID=A0A816ILS7_BRANA|nr:unnamed protein product [Brassica napus]